MPILSTTHRKGPPTRHLIQGLNPILETLRQLDIDPAPYLTEANVTFSALSNPTSYLTAEQELNFTQQIINTLEQPDIGLTIGSRYHLSTYGILGLAIMTSDNLVEAAKVLFKNVLMTWTYMHWSLSEDKDIATMSLQPLRDLGDCHQYMIDRGLIASYLIFQEALGHPLPLRDLYLTQSSSDYAARYRKLFDCRINIGAKINSYTFDAEYVYEHLPQADVHSNAIYSDECEKICKKLDDEYSFSDLIRQHVLTLDRHEGSLEAIANKIHTTPRTIQRKLTAEGTSYNKLLMDVRCNLAIEYLKSTSISTSEIAIRLGYADSSAFCHAFKRWTSKSPGAYRD